MNKKKVALIAADLFACGHKRVIEPFSKLQDDEFEFDVWLPQKMAGRTGRDIFEDLRKYNCVIFQRPGHRVINSLIINLKRANVVVGIEIDDDLFNVSPMSPAHKTWNKDSDYLKAYEQALRLADFITCSTPELKDSLSGYCDNIQVFLNAIDFNNHIYLSNNSRRNELPSDKIAVSWMGSSTHLDSLQSILPHFREIFQRRSNAIFALCSNKEFLDMFKIRKEQKHYIPHVPIEEYPTIPSMADIGITPVVPNQFNACKSELKILEYGIWGIPSVSTDSAPYRRFFEVSGGANYLVPNNSPKKWMDAIHELIDDPELRKEKGQRTYEVIREFYNLEKINKERLKFFKELLK